MLTTTLAPSRNGTTPAPARKPRRAKKTAAGGPPVKTTADRVKVVATVTMGVAIPVLSLVLSHTGGTLARTGHSALAGFALSLMGCVLVVSLSHLAWAIEDITRSPRWASWLLAISFDLMLVLGELVHVNADDAGVGMAITVMMTAVAGMSMFLNCWAFLRHPKM